MLSIKSKPSIDQLEASLSDAKAKLEATRADYREARHSFEDAKSLLALSDSLDNAAAHRAALEDVQAAAAAVAIANDDVKAAELALDLLRTGPARAETAKVINKGADRVERALVPLVAPLTELVRALDEVTWPEIYLYDRSHQQLHGQMLDALLALQGTAGQQFVAALRNYADGIVSGKYGYNLSSTAASEQIAVGIRKSA